jgi:hypothetical protein
MKPIVDVITDEWIKKYSPCPEAIEWWDKKERNSLIILNKLMEDKQYNFANWFIVRIMTYRDYVSYAVYAAEQVIDIYEKRYPDDKRPRNAIEAAKKCIENPSKENKTEATYAAYAAAFAANAAAYAAAACAAAFAAADAANAAAYAANAAADAAAARNKMKLKILKYGIKLLTEQK